MDPPSRSDQPAFTPAGPFRGPPRQEGMLPLSESTIRQREQRGANQAPANAPTAPRHQGQRGGHRQRGDGSTFSAAPFQPPLPAPLPARPPPPAYYPGITTQGRYGHPHPSQHLPQQYSSTGPIYPPGPIYMPQDMARVTHAGPAQQYGISEQTQHVIWANTHPFSPRGRGHRRGRGGHQHGRPRPTNHERPPIPAMPLQETVDDDRDSQVTVRPPINMERAPTSTPPSASSTSSHSTLNAQAPDFTTAGHAATTPAPAAAAPPGPQRVFPAYGLSMRRFDVPPVVYDNGTPRPSPRTEASTNLPPPNENGGPSFPGSGSNPSTREFWDTRRRR